MDHLASVFAAVVLSFTGASMLALVVFIVSDAIADRRAVANTKAQKARLNISNVPQASRRAARRRAKDEPTTAASAKAA